MGLIRRAVPQVAPNSLPRAVCAQVTDSSLLAKETHSEAFFLEPGTAYPQVITPFVSAVTERAAVVAQPWAQEVARHCFESWRDTITASRVADLDPQAPPRRRRKTDEEKRVCPVLTCSVPCLPLGTRCFHVTVPLCVQASEALKKKKQRMQKAVQKMDPDLLASLGYTIVQTPGPVAAPSPVSPAPGPEDAPAPCPAHTPSPSAARDGSQVGG